MREIEPLQSKIGFAHALRGIAALTVLVGHFAYVFWTMPGAVAALVGAPPIQPAPYWFTAVLDCLPPAFFGHFGVALFFLISGFVIPFSLVNRSRLEFAIARVFRLWPTYAAGLSITVLFVIACTWFYGTPLPFSWGTYLLQLLFVRDLAWVPSIDGIVWTLEIEAKFYVLMAALAPAIQRGSIALIAATVALLTLLGVGTAYLPGWLASAATPYKILYGLTLSGQMICYMLIGTVFNFMYRGMLSWRVAAPVTLIFFVGMCAQWPLGTISQAVNGIYSYGIAVAVFVGAYIARGRLQRVPRALSWLADISYPLYVVHGVAGYVLMRFAVDAGFGILGSIAVGASFAFFTAWVMHRHVEVPTQLVGKRWGKLASKASKPTPQPARLSADMYWRPEHDRQQ
jgi:peptidoglycan/LPS O-acetylase OafA/YrhL